MEGIEKILKIIREKMKESLKKVKEILQSKEERLKRDRKNGGKIKRK